MERYPEENRILDVNKQPMSPCFLSLHLRFVLILLVLVSANKFAAQVKVPEPVPYEMPVTDEEGYHYNGREWPLRPSVSGRYWTHKHEKYFDSFEEIKADSQNVVRLYISSSDGGEIPADIGKFVNLKGLEIYCSMPIVIPEEVFRLTKLENLVIQCYDSTMVIPEVIGELTSLQRLEIRGPITRIPPSIGNLKNLEELYLYSGKFPSVPSEIGKLTNLQTLVIRSMAVTELPASIGNLVNLRKLQVESRINTLPAEIGKLAMLGELNLWNTNLETLPAEIGQLKLLRFIDISSQRLTSLPKEFGDLSMLLKVDLDGNKLTSLPDEICKLTAVTELNLRSNQLTALPRDIGKMLALKNLDVQENSLVTLPASIGYLSNLTELNVLWNPLTSLPPEIMKLNPQASLDLERSSLLNIPDSIWRFISQNGCYISKVPATIAGNKLSYYLNQPSIDKAAKLFVSGKLSLMYDQLSYNLLKKLDTIPDNHKAFYVFVINAILESQVIDRGTNVYDYYPYSEIADICNALVVQRPCTFFKDIKYGAYKASYEKWLYTIGGLYNNYDYQEDWPKIQAKLKTCGSAYLKEAEEIIEPLFYSEK
ncbi:MAG TPA: leucine-rich repeat domain-containing protein [Fluviicola sp.]|nr:leucine-rich repeat domain-containing protein [Fluviicola sp.]